MGRDGQKGLQCHSKKLGVDHEDPGEPWNVLELGHENQFRKIILAASFRTTSRRETRGWEIRKEVAPIDKAGEAGSTETRMGNKPQIGA